MIKPHMDQVHRYERGGETTSYIGDPLPRGNPLPPQQLTNSCCSERTKGSAVRSQSLMERSCDPETCTYNIIIPCQWLSGLFATQLTTVSPSLLMVKHHTSPWWPWNNVIHYLTSGPDSRHSLSSLSITLTLQTHVPQVKTLIECTWA